jgi:U3 small nucleolar ribonucleoprotein component
MPTLDNSSAVEILASLRDHFSDVSEDEFFDDQLSDFQDNNLSDEEDDIVPLEQPSPSAQPFQFDELDPKVFDLEPVTTIKRTFSFQSIASPTSPASTGNDNLSVDFLQSILQEIDEDEYPLYDESIDYGDYYDPRTNRKLSVVIKEKKERRQARRQSLLDALTPTTPSTPRGVSLFAKNLQRMQVAQKISRQFNLNHLHDEITSNEVC